MAYIDLEKLIAEIDRRIRDHKKILKKYNTLTSEAALRGSLHAYESIKSFITSLQQERPSMIQWTGHNLKEVIDFTGKSPRFEEWFKSWEEYENHVHTHNDILKLFCEDGSHYEIPVGAWIVKAPDGRNVPSVAKHIQQVQPEFEYIRKDALMEWLKMAVESYSHPDTVNKVDKIRCEGKKWAFQDVIDKIESLWTEKKNNF